MSPTILLDVKSNLEKASIINAKRIDKLIDNMKYWQKGGIVYPSHVKSVLFSDYKVTYEVLEIIKKMGLLEYNYEIYCTECEKFIDSPILRSLNDFPEKIYCENNHKLDPLKDTVLIFRVIKDE
jgi:hypothetical protein